MSPIFPINEERFTNQRCSSRKKKKHGVVLKAHVFPGFQKYIHLTFFQECHMMGSFPQ